MLLCFHYIGLLFLQECPGDIFIEGIFVPSYESGKLQTLENLLESIDPSLESWSTYLIDACKHLQKKGFYNILYEIQQFMKVSKTIKLYLFFIQGHRKILMIVNQWVILPLLRGGNIDKQATTVEGEVWGVKKRTKNII